MQLTKYLFVSILIFNILVLKAEAQNSKNNKMSLGVELGAVPSFLFSDISNQAFGLGLGYQLGVNFTYMNDRPIVPKVRIEHIYMRQEALNRADMSYLIKDSYFKAMVQEYTIIMGGAEFREEGRGYAFFYEANLGYALGVSGSVETVPKQGQAAVNGKKVPLRSGFVLGGGLGLRRKLSDMITGVASARTMFMLGSTYLGDLNNRSFIPLPFVLSVSAEFNF